MLIVSEQTRLCGTLITDPLPSTVWLILFPLQHNKIMTIAVSAAKHTSQPTEVGQQSGLRWIITTKANCDVSCVCDLTGLVLSVLVCLHYSSFTHTGKSPSFIKHKFLCHVNMDMP